MKLTAAMLLGVLAIARCPGEQRVEDRDPDRERDTDCWGMAVGWGTCEPGVQPIDPEGRLGFDKRYYDPIPQPAFVDSVSGASMVLEGPWNMPYTFTWFESLEGIFAAGDDVVLSDGPNRQWSVVTGPRATVAQFDSTAFSAHPPERPTEDGPDLDFVPGCRTADTDRPVYALGATLGEDGIEIAQGERGRIGDWELVFHGAASAPGQADDCFVLEGYFHGVVSAWKRQ